MSDPAAVDREELEAFSGAVAGYKAGEFVALMIHLGDRLGLYKALAGAGPRSAAELAQTTGLHERWLLEWLRGQAAAKLVAYRGDDRFELMPAGATVLVQGDSPHCMVGLFAGPPTPTPVVDRVAEAFRTGVGMTFDDHGPDVAHMGARLTRAVHKMLPSVLDPLDAGPRLQRGARVVDVGCGSGLAILALARAYPRSEFHGYDPSSVAIGQAREEGRAQGASNVTWHVAGGEDLPPEGAFDLALTLDCMHDLPHPGKVVAAIRQTLKPDGTWIIKDVRSSAKFEENLENPMATLCYGFSVLYCMSSSLSEPGGAGTGTMGFNPQLAEEMTRAGGFTRFRQLDFEADPLNVFYEVRP